MNEGKDIRHAPADALAVNKDDFDLATLEDELRVDGLCRELLLSFYNQLLQEGITPDRATELAGGADYFVRDFVVAFRQRNLFDERPGLVRQFGGNWYIVNTLEPDIAHLAGILEGTCSFYRFLRSRGLISADYLQNVEAECAARNFYADRIASFWEIAGDGYLAWERECTLKEG